MDRFRVNQLLIEAIKSKISPQKDLVNYITDLLFIEKEAVYRRIRGEVLFSLWEATTLAHELNLSLDELISKVYNKDKTSMTIHLPQHYTGGLQEPWHIEQDLYFLKELTAEPYSEMGVALSDISSSLYYYYSHLARFYHFKYFYNLGEKMPYSKVHESPQQIQYRRDFYDVYHKMSTTYYIWDRSILNNLKSDILYFHNIQLISREEVLSIKKDLYTFLKDLHKWCDLGRYPDTGNKFELFVSNTHIDLIYAYMWTEKKYASMYTAFTLLTTSSVEEIPFNNLSHWIKSLKRCSEQISFANEKERIRFFEEQLAIVDSIEV